MIARTRKVEDEEKRDKFDVFVQKFRRDPCLSIVRVSVGLSCVCTSRCGKKWKTRVIDKTLTPVWDERFCLDVEETAKRIVVDVYDDDILGETAV